MSIFLSNNLSDPITDEPLINPVVDPCGHYYNKSTVKIFVDKYGDIFRCPFSREKVNVREFKELKELGKSIHKVVESEEAKEIGKARNDKLECLIETLLSNFSKIHRDLATTNRKMDLMNKKMDHVSAQNIILNKKVNNFSSMSGWDHTVAIFSSRRKKKMINRGITRAEKQLLKIPVSQIELDDDSSQSSSEDSIKS